jgi:hypothetical protein
MKLSLVYGVGINDAPYQTTIQLNGATYTCPYFIRWRTMIGRCYDKTYQKNNPSYSGCTVTPAWHSFMAFKAWMMTQFWQDQQLDKDLLSKGSKNYSPETCLFVSRQVNSFFNERGASRGTLPLGIYARKEKFEVGVSLGAGKRTWVGVYNNVPDAIDAYLQAKAKAAQKLAKEQTDPAIKQAILDYSEYFTDKHSRLKAGY